MFCAESINIYRCHTGEADNYFYRKDYLLLNPRALAKLIFIHYTLFIIHYQKDTYKELRCIVFIFYVNNEL